MTRRSPSRVLGLDRYSGFYIFLLFFVVFAVWTPHLFLSRVTLYSVADTNAIVAMLGVALVVPLAAGVYDLSVGAVIGFSAIVVSTLQSDHHWNMWAAIGLAVALCVIIGVVNGFVVVKLHVNSFITTLGMATIITAFQSIASGNSQPLPPASSAWRNLSQFKVGGFQIVVIYLLIITAIFWWVLARTPMGRYLYAVGGNPEAARLSGVNVGKWTWLSLIISAGMCGVAGVLYASQNGPSLTFGPALLLPAFAAAFLGSTQIKPGRVNAIGTLLAVYVLATGVKGLQLVTGVQWLNDMFNGVALIAAVAFAVWQQRRSTRAGASSAPDHAPETFEVHELPGLDHLPSESGPSPVNDAPVGRSSGTSS